MQSIGELLPFPAFVCFVCAVRRFRQNESVCFASPSSMTEPRRDLKTNGLKLFYEKDIEIERITVLQQ